MRTGFIAIMAVLFTCGILASACETSDDKVPPVITLIGDNPLHVQLGTSFTDPGASALDDVDGNISAQIEVTGTVNTQVEGDYYIYYNVEDKAGNKAAEVSRKVKVLIF
jgi:hypothetical protein